MTEYEKKRIAKKEAMLQDQLSLYKVSAIIAISELRLDSKKEAKIKEELRGLVSYIGFSRELDNGKIYSQNEKYITKIQHLIDKHANTSGYNSNSHTQYEIEDAISQKLGDRFGKNPEYDSNDYFALSHEKDKNAQEISSNPSKALQTVLRKYQNAVSAYQQLLNTKKYSEEYEQKKSQEDQEKRAEAKSTTASTQNPKYYSKDEVDQIVDNAISQGKSHLSYAEAEALEKAHPGLHSYDITREYDHLYNTQKLESTIANYEQKKYNHDIYDMVQELMELGKSVYKNLPEYLLRDDSQLDYNSAKFMNKFQVGNSLEKYDELYNKFMSLYKKMPDELKASANKTFNDYAKFYFSALNIDKSSREYSVNDILNADALKAKVNEVVAKEYERSFDDVKGLARDDGNGVQRFIKATKYMSEEEIVNLYKTISLRNTGYTPESQEQAVELARKSGILQKNVARALANRANLRGITSEMTEAEKEQVMRELEECVVGICKDYFKESPKFETRYVDPSLVKDGIGINRIQGGKAIKEAEIRYFGLNKLSQALKKSEFKKLEALRSSQAVMTDSEILEVNSMFKR